MSTDLSSFEQDKKALLSILEGQWKGIHEHSSVPVSQGWDGKIVGGEERV